MGVATLAGARVALVSDLTQDAVDAYDRMLTYVARGDWDFSVESAQAGMAKSYEYAGPTQRQPAIDAAHVEALPAARCLGWVLCNERQSDRTALLQFHPSMSYEDFVRGFRPGSDGKLTLIDGPLLTAAKNARQDCECDYVVVIEEINRGNPAQIFGEMLTLLEHDKRDPENALNLAYSRDGEGPFHLPSNLHLIGTMNVEDRSLAPVDIAIRRRFAFFDLGPEYNDARREFVIERGYDESVVDRIAVRMTRLNEVIAADPHLGKDYCIGHSYFTCATRLARVLVASAADDEARHRESLERSLPARLRL
ncbi:McrB family protein [Rhodococcus opacus]|uniref:McrB family protein n=1 Tax=Rhodococcus opacus TaxID=37919 RepID=UPI002476CD20|nr:AAA family ATPase [Rhodococcus opacus]MDH6293471.1 hypothetical protein [Rhodococcus opacus]